MITPELMKEINATPKDGTVVAMFYLKGNPAPGKPTEELVRKVLERVKDAGRPTIVNVFDKLSSFVATGTPGFIMHLALQPEIDRATPNGS